MAVAPTVQDRQLLIDGVRIHYVEAGSGPPVVLVHGIAASGLDWHFTIPAVASSFTAIVPDLPGFGQSAVPTVGNTSLADGLRFLDQFLDALDLEAVALVGNSMGGLICGHYAITRPARVRQLALVDPAGLARDVSWYFRLLTLPLLGKRLLRPRPDAAALVARGLFADPRRAPDWWLADKVLDRGPAARRYLLLLLRSGVTVFGLDRRLAMLEGLARLTVPLLVVWGAEDRVIPAWHLALVRSHLPRARTHLMRRAGHVPMLERPDEFNQVLLRFLTMR